MWYIYILLCSDKSLYTGATNNIKKRFEDHKNGKGGHYTKAHPPYKILYSETFSSKSEALKREYEIKQWTRKKKITTFGLSIKP